MKPPEALNKMADLVLNYRPKPKSKSAKKRAKKATKKGKGLNPALEALYRTAKKADDDFQAAVVRQFGAKEAGDARYRFSAYNAATARACNEFHDAMNRYLKVCREERKRA